MLQAKFYYPYKVLKNLYYVKKRLLSMIIIIIISFLLVLSFFSINATTTIVKPVFGQFMMDSFSAKGIIATQLPENFDFGKQNMTSGSSDSINKSISNMNSNSENNPNLPILKGEWVLEVKKGTPEVFRSIFAIVEDRKIVNAFAIYNLRDTPFIQLNDKGIEIIQGKVDFQSTGFKNETINNIDATITILGLSQIRITLDEISATKYFNDNPIVGQTKLLVDGSGNLLIGPAPPPSESRKQSPSSPGKNPLQQSNDLI
jgi:hypothetical protein